MKVVKSEGMVVTEWMRVVVEMVVVLEMVVVEMVVVEMMVDVG